jgi:flagellin
MTNASAMTALKTLQMTNKSLDQTENRISTGYKVATASDNAAYWSIATTMRSDNKALSTVQDALGLGAATVDVAYTAMDSVKDVLDQIKTKLVSASQPGVDKSKIQSDISELQKQLQTYASSASFSGNNWLSVDSSSSSYNATQSVVSSFNRSSDNQVSISTIDVNITGVSLFDANANASGILEKGQALTTTGGVADSAGTDGTGDAATGTTASTAFAYDFTTNGAMTINNDDAITFKFAVNGGDATDVTIDRSTVDTALGTSDGKVGSSADMEKVMVQALKNAGIDAVNNTGTASATGVKVDGTTAGTVTITTGLKGTDASLVTSGTASSNNGNFYDVMKIDITNASADDLKAYSNAIETMSGKVTTAAANLGSVKSRIDMQQDFVKNLMDAVDRGVGALVDADMSQESTRLQALQTQQQLGIQALSIANSNSQSILSLFR